MVRFLSSADANAMIARTAPAVLELLGDGVARSKKAIVAALADRHAKDEVVLTLMRLAVTGQVIDTAAGTAWRPEAPPARDRTSRGRTSGIRDADRRLAGSVAPGNA